ncbi:MBL fold metallo-hydrolase [Sulfidibacter corallicola]|uniref:MBL fold metallo-hydrolase n=1 Tax=Sulfidibacter corallicola TaxID=2818388 RepID=A0A8A4TFV7_SULCO|nr:MBL fold metallo-hydrolase [Sulfidibacter corallicola]QTD47641.1 MBL fold metallo-hydrolase [Sulfidibacter corallicola]
MRKHKIAEMDGVTWWVFGRDPEKSDHVIDTNEYLIVHEGEGLLLDPGGYEIFPQVAAAVSEVIEIESITHFFCSHQDPDIMSSLPLWMGLCPKAKIYMPWIWSGFIAHFGHEYVDRFVKVPDCGTTIGAQNAHHKFVLLPAHYCHSSGNFSLYDPVCKIIFSGDIGAALLPEDAETLYVEDFDNHIQYMEGFHKRWMPSNEAKNQWIEQVRQLEVTYLCPQHGGIFKGAQVTQFLDWFAELKVGSALEESKSAPNASS